MDFVQCNNDLWLIVVFCLVLSPCGRCHQVGMGSNWLQELRKCSKAAQVTDCTFSLVQLWKSIIQKPLLFTLRRPHTSLLWLPLILRSNNIPYPCAFFNTCSFSCRAAWRNNFVLLQRCLTLRFRCILGMCALITSSCDRARRPASQPALLQFLLRFLCSNGSIETCQW